MQIKNLVEIAMYLGEMSVNEHCYISKDEILYFVTGGKLYAVPWTHYYIKILNDSKFKRDKVPVKSIYFYTNFDKQKWDKLWQDVKELERKRA